MLINRPLLIGDKIKLNSVSGHEYGWYVVRKIRNYAKDRRIYLESQYGYGCQMWENNINYELVDYA